MSKQTEILDSVRRFAQKYHDNNQHSEQVTLLAERLFDLLEPVHGIAVEYKWLLSAGSILHDIGWIQGQSKHHKASMEMILSDKTLPLGSQDRNRIALIARYHRKALPKESHSVYGQLPADQKRIVESLGGILRLADGLDRSHTNAVERLDIEIGSNWIQIQCFGGRSLHEEVQYGQTKADLLEQSLNMKIRVVCGDEKRR
jgi:exopolyphosphatase/guanosine-5'-triphosphate,3'-diphosphate pyrophosphatase